ncbi:hypothetical protein Tco_0518261 [Tanacetum coccineum]
MLVKENRKAARGLQKSYVDYRRKPLEFEVGDRVLLKVTPWKGVVCFGKKGKLAPRYVEPFEILERIVLVAYRLRLHEELNSVHDTFHVVNLKKCLADANLHVLLDAIKVNKTLRFVEEPVEIMDREIKKLKCVLSDLNRRVTCGYPWPELEGKGFGMIQERLSECLFDANHAMCLIDHVNSMNVRAKSASKKNKKRKEWKPTGKVFNYVGYKWKPTGRTFTLDGNACPLTRLTATNKVPLRVPIPLEVVAPKHVVTRVYTRRPKVPKSVPNSKPKVLQIVLCDDQVAKIIGYGDYQIRNVTISRVYYVEGLGHNVFSVVQSETQILK